MGWWCFELTKDSSPGHWLLGDVIVRNSLYDPTVNIPYGSEKAYLLFLTVISSEGSGMYDESILMSDDSKAFVSLAFRDADNSVGWHESIDGSCELSRPLYAQGTYYVDPLESRFFSFYQDADWQYGSPVFVRPESNAGYTGDFSIFESLMSEFTPGGGTYQTAFFHVESPITTVPEPCTLAVWSLLGGIGAVVGWSRRRR
jgi:hypothetical protein